MKTSQTPDPETVTEATNAKERIVPKGGASVPEGKVDHNTAGPQTPGPCTKALHSSKKPITLPIAVADRERFYKKLNANPDPEACHPWPCGTSGGKGRFWLQGETRYAHQVAWILERGAIPDGCDVFCVCAEPTCCNVKHLRLGVANATTDENLREKFMAKVEIQRYPKPGMTTPCWIWTGSKGTQGYPVLNCFGKHRKGSHVAYYLKNGSWPPSDLGMLHDCDEKLCVSIDHLHVGTNTENCRERDERNRTARGERHGSQTKPESVRRGELNGRSELTVKQVVMIRRTCDAYRGMHGLFAYLSRLVGVGQDVVGDIAARRSWRSVPEDAEPDVEALTRAELDQLKKAWPCGEECASAKLTDREVREIRCLAQQNAGSWGLKRLLAERYGVSDGQISRIMSRKQRGEVEDRFDELGELPPLKR